MRACHQARPAGPRSQRQPIQASAASASAHSQPQTRKASLVASSTLVGNGSASPISTNMGRKLGTTKVIMNTSVATVITSRMAG